MHEQQWEGDLNVSVLQLWAEAVGAARLQDRVCAVSDVQEQPRLFPPAVRVRHSLISLQTSEEQSCS